MADVKRIATRASYGEALVELGAEHDDFVVFDADLAAATQTAKFKAAYPDRFFDAGIAESNLMGMAAGVATTGRVAFASTFAMFAAALAAWPPPLSTTPRPMSSSWVAASLCARVPT